MWVDGQNIQFDEINKKYFEILIHLRTRGIVPLKGEDLSFTLTGLPIFSYKDLKQKEATYLKKARESSLWLKKAHGGGGTSIKRTAYLKIMGKDPTIGAKGTDLFISLGSEDEDKDLFPLAEIQILQAIESLNSNEFGEVFLDDLVSEESRYAVQKIWSKNSWIDNRLTYLELKEKYKAFHKFKEIRQASLPTLNEEGQFTTKRMAPGGHAFFAFETLLTALNGKGPNCRFEDLISVVGNGEDLGSTPDGVVVGWIIDEKIPIAMVTTDKTEIDTKGGLIARKKEGSLTTVTIVERAQAQEAGILDLFQKTRGFFNTNVAIFNYKILVPKLKKLRDKIGQDGFEKVIAPALIKNVKFQEETDGIHKYEQLEGAMGSTLLNLDRAYRHSFHEPLVSFINIDRENRTRFFSPVKMAFDFFMLFHSDRFSLNRKNFKLVDHRPGALPLVSLPQKYYEEVQNILDAFNETQILDLDELRVEGEPVILGKLKLIGKVKIINTTEGLFNLTLKLKEMGIKELRNQSVRVTPQGTLIIS